MVAAQLSSRSPALATYQPVSRNFWRRSIACEHAPEVHALKVEASLQARCRSTRLPVRAMAHRHEQQAGNPVAAVALAALLTVASGSMSAADAKMVLGKQFSSTEASGSAFDMKGVLAAQSREGSQSTPCRLLIAQVPSEDGACSTSAFWATFALLPTGIKKRGLMAGKRKELMASAREKASKETNKAAEQVSKAVKK